MAQDYYKTLGVDKKASQEEVKKAFRKLAHEHHPDRGGNEARFKEVNEAYQVLGNEKKRAQYDTYGQTFSGAGPTGQGPFGAGGFNTQGWDFSGFSAGGGSDFGGDVDLGDIFSDFFGGGRSRRRASRRGADISVDLEVPLTDILLGAEKVMRINKFVPCTSCKGSGAEGSELIKCATCNGAGTTRSARHTIFGSVNMETVCNDCDGAGKRPKNKCDVCKGMGIVRTNEEIRIIIPQGMENGETLKFAGRGEAIRQGPSGDLYARIHVRMPTKFSKTAHEALVRLREEGI